MRHDRASSPTPTWTIKSHAGTEDEEVFTNGELLFAGDPWTRRTTIFAAKDQDRETVIVKEYYRLLERSFPEEELLHHVHADGDVPGVVRIRADEVVTVDGMPIECGPWDDDSLREKVRMVMWDYGEPLENARSVNDLLCCFYDAIEGTLVDHVILSSWLITPCVAVHRIMFTKRNILHRDMSKFNILIYPRWSEKTNGQIMQGAPPFIYDLLAEEPR